MDGKLHVPQVKVALSGISDVGSVRTNNEDRFLIADVTSGHEVVGEALNGHMLSDRGTLLVVSDGMGGAEAGEVASRIVVESLRDGLSQAPPVVVADDALRNVVEQVNAEIWTEATNNPKCKGMGATLAAACTSALCADGAALTPFKEAGAPPAPWRVVGLPGQNPQAKPFTEFSVVEIDGRKALRVDAKLSFGNLVHPVKWTAPAATLSWQWRVDEALPNADLRVRQGDDTALKVCVSFDLPMEQVPFVERQLLRAGQSKTSEPLATANVCYVWDANLPVGTTLDNAFSRRTRYIVLQSGSANLKQWKTEKRDVTADFKKVFADENDGKVAAVTAVGIGADSDNTKGHSVGYVANIVLEP